MTEDWNDFIKGYKFEVNESVEMQENNQHFLLKRKSEIADRRTAKSQSYDRSKNDRSCVANSLQILKNRIKDNNIQTYESNVLNIEKYSYQKHLLKCHDNKDKVKKLFDNHSSWLKNMRNEVPNFYFLFDLLIDFPFIVK